jgi:hypothetical protein
MNKEDAEKLLQAFAITRREQSKIHLGERGWIYPDEVWAFFKVVADANWLDHQYQAGRDMKRLRDPSYLVSASVDELCSMITAAWRGERFFEGLWKDVFCNGHMERAMQRLASIFGLEPHIT